MYKYNLSIIVPSFCHEKYIIECLDSIAKISISDKEIIIIDDGSTDRSVEFIRKWVSDCQYTVKFIYHENKGLVKVLNEGLKIAQGEFIYFIASDDVTNSLGIEFLVQKLSLNKSVKFAMGNALLLHTNHHADNRNILYKKKHDAFFNLPPVLIKEEIYINYPTPLLLQSTVFRKDILDQIGGWDEENPWDDFPIFVKILTNFPKKNIDFFYEKNNIVCFYRKHQENSYNNIIKTASLVVKSLEMITPVYLKKQAISLAYSRYAISALYNFKINDFIEITKILFFKYGFLYSVKSILKVIKERIKNRITDNLLVLL